MAGDEFECRLVGARCSNVGAGDPGGILTGEKRRITAGDGEARCTGAVGCCERVKVPSRGIVKAVVRCVTVAGENDVFVGEQRGDVFCAGVVGLGSDAADERKGFRGRGDDQLLPGAEVEADANGDFSKAIELLLEGKLAEIRVAGGRRQQ